MITVNVVLLVFEVLDWGKGTVVPVEAASTDSVFVIVGFTTSSVGVGDAALRCNCSEVEMAVVLVSVAEVEVD